MAAANDKTPREKLWTPANIVTVIRICFVPVFVIAILAPWPEWVTIWPNADVWKPWIAAAIFTLLAATDGVDGYLARSRGEVTNFGKFVDPLADKILVTAALLVLIELGVLPSWIALVILAREFIVSGIRMLAATQGVVIAASWYGKAKTVTQIVAIVMFIIKDSVVISETVSVLVYPLYILSWIVMAAAVVLTIVSMLDYFVKAKDLLGFGSSREEGATDAAEEADDSALRADCLDEKQAALAADIVGRAAAAGVTLAAAESLTGGLVAAALTSVPGSSQVMRGGVVSYAIDVKHEVLGVDDALLASQGAVNEQTARQMAEGARCRLGADVAVSTTGIAGPTGEEPGKPVGTVWVGVSTSEGCFATEHRFCGSRDEVRAWSVTAALSALAAQLPR